MNIVGWGAVALVAVLSIINLMGKGSSLIAGYNTASQEQKEKYNVKKLCRVMGGGLAVIAIMMAVSMYYNFNFPLPILQYMFPWGLFIVIAIMLILANTVCKKTTI